MKNAAAGLLVTIGLLVCAGAHAEPSSRSAGNENARAKSAVTDEQRTALPAKTATGVEGVVPGNPKGLTLFNAADGNHDGIVSYRELAAVVSSSTARRIQARFRQLDRNRDGRVTRREVNKMTAERFARFDRNRDGTFTVSELAQALTEPVTVRLREVYARLDVDGSGALSVAELAPQPKRKPATAVARVSKDPGRKVKDVAKRASVAQ